MDTSEQLYPEEASGWQRGLYDDVRATFRAPVVNWIWRTLTANEPAFARYLWGQVKPVFETRAFASLTVDYRDSVLSTVEDAVALPSYRRADLGVSPAEYGELRGQVATFDVVAPRLAVLFRLVNRSLRGDGVSASPAPGVAATSPFPAWLDADRGRPPTMVPFDEFGDDVAETAAAFQSFHGFETGLPSVYRCLAQWPSFFTALWRDLGPVLESETYEDACEQTDDLVDTFVDEVAYAPRLDSASLAAAGFADETVTDVRALFQQFDEGPVATVLPALHLWPATVDASGERDW